MWCVQADLSFSAETQDGGAKGVNALPWMCKEGSKTHLKDGRSDIL
ncbi:unnamed protein product [Rhodiola kirilowii]